MALYKFLYENVDSIFILTGEHKPIKTLLFIIFEDKMGMIKHDH